MLPDLKTTTNFQQTFQVLVLFLFLNIKKLKTKKETFLKNWKIYFDHGVPSSIWLMNELLEPIGHPITLDEQDPGTTPVTESPSTFTRKSSLKKMYLIKKIFKNLITCEN